MSVQQEKFKAIADKIREKTNTEDLIVPNDFADKIDDVYLAGRDSAMDKDKAILGKAKGEKFYVDDVSETIHGVKCTVSAETENLSQVTVCKYGKNLFDKNLSGVSAFQNETAWGGYGTTIITADNLKKMLSNNTTYTISCEVECESIPQDATISTKLIGFSIYDRTKGAINLYETRELSPGQKYKFSKTFTTPEDFKTSTYAFMAYSNGYHLNEGPSMEASADVGEYTMGNDFPFGDGFPFDDAAPNATTVYAQVIYKNIQIEEGEHATEFEPCNVQSATAAQDGTVTGLTSVSPCMSILSDTPGVNISVEYYKSQGAKREYDKFWDSFQDYGNATNYSRAFQSPLWNDINYNPKYDIVAADDLFNSNPSITDTKVIIKADGKTLKNTFANSALEKIRLFVDAETNSENAFDGLTNLKSLTILGGSISTDGWDFSSAVNFPKDGITTLIMSLSMSAEGNTITFSQQAVDNAFQPEEWEQIKSTRPNWTIKLSN